MPPARAGISTALLTVARCASCLPTVSAAVAGARRLLTAARSG